MRVGILTFHGYSNYGAVLQCWALQLALDRLGVASKVLNFRPRDMEPKRRIWQGWGLRDGKVADALAARLVRARYGSRAQAAFEDFQSSRLRLTESLESNEQFQQAINDTDALIVGSDQVWNPTIYFHPAFYLEFGGSYHGKRISYAASCGHFEPGGSLQRSVAAWLRRFDSISVRDSMTNAMVKELAGVQANIVADPTLLVDVEAFGSPPAVPFRNYILVYALGTRIHENGDSFIRQVKEALGLPIVSVVSSAHVPAQSRYADHVLYTASPEEWLGLINNASFICTDSFHGTIFAIKSRKRFVTCVADRARSSRLYDMAQRYGIEDRLVAGADALETAALWERAIDYDAVHARIHAHVGESIAFLRESLGAEMVSC